MAIKLKVCAECFSVNSGERVSSHIGSVATREIFEGFDHWREYQLLPLTSPLERAYIDFLNDTSCGICRRSLTGDRRQRNDGNPEQERRVLPDGDRRTAFSRGSRVLIATCRAA
jgi:hypothetical protein